MLSSNKYTTGLAIAEQLKYNIHYNKAIVFDVVCASLASKLLSQQYVELDEAQQIKLNKIAGNEQK